MSKALEWLEAESDRLEKECNENNDPHKTVNHSFLEGFNYALLNAQDLEQIQLDDNQQIVLQWLKLTASTGKPMQVVFWMMNNAAWGHLDELRDLLMELTDKQQFEVLTAFAQWGLEREEEG
ncbi:hypothetical protein NV666_08785 [Enterococcus lactis]|uniref:hypothetical protein n=1 Tax=Enterococcus lactis TaxID=357441 RepID=UPI0022F2AFFC|nr:hypothetical protein [Enterococcus lactis]MDA5331151.1 hypothetical protein [Enterococcus lactis]